MSDQTKTILIVGASRGLGLGLAQEYAKRGWHVIGTVRGASPRTGLHALADDSKGRVRIEVAEARPVHDVEQVEPVHRPQRRNAHDRQVSKRQQQAAGRRRVLASESRGHQQARRKPDQARRGKE